MNWLEHAVAKFDHDAFKDGDVITKVWLEEALLMPPIRKLSEVDKITLMFLSRFDAFRGYLLTERKIALDNVYRKGWRLVPPEEQAQLAVQTAARLIKKGVDQAGMLLDHARLTQMDQTARQRHIDTRVKMSGLRGIMLKQRADIFQAFIEAKKK